MKILFVHDWEPDFLQEMTQRDGIFRALEVLKDRGHDVRVITFGDKSEVWQHEYFPISVFRRDLPFIEAVDADVILFWADLTRPHIKEFAKFGKPMALCFAGGDTGRVEASLFDHIFVESEVYKEAFERKGYSVSTAFGTNMKFFDPEHPTLKNVPRVIDVIFPATYCDWKRHNLFTDAIKELRKERPNVVALCCGYMYTTHEQYCWEYPQANGILTLPHADANTLRHLLKASKACLITSKASGGSQRTVLESLAMNTPVVALSDSDKTTEYLRHGSVGHISEPTPQAIKESLISAISMTGDTRGRDYVSLHWSEHHYADALEQGLTKICASQ